MGIVNAIPSKWRSLIKAKSYCVPLPLERTLFQITIVGKLVDLLDVTSKMVYNEFRSHKQTPPTAKAKLMSRYPDLSIEWKRLYSLAFEITLDTKLREFQYKLLNLIIFTNKKLYQFKMVELPPYAPFVTRRRNPWSIYCIFVSRQDFFEELLSWLANEFNISFNVTLLDILFGKFDIGKDFLIINHILVLSKFFIYKCKYSNLTPSLTVFKAKLKAIYKLELYIAKKNGILLKHFKRWESFLRFFS